MRVRPKVSVKSRCCVCFLTSRQICAVLISFLRNTLNHLLNCALSKSSPSVHALIKSLCTIVHLPSNDLPRKSTLRIHTKGNHTRTRSQSQALRQAGCGTYTCAAPPEAATDALMGRIIVVKDELAGARCHCCTAMAVAVVAVPGLFDAGGGSVLYNKAAGVRRAGGWLGIPATA
jgi:hypothetical protein